MPFDPDKFLAQPDVISQAPPLVPKTDEFSIPEQVQPLKEAEPAFDPDAFLAPENQAQYGTGEQQAKTFGEAVARGAVSQPIATIGERAAGVPAEDILGREKANPWTNFFGELTGFGLGAISGVGEAAWLARAGEAATAAIGAGKIGAPVIKELITGLSLVGGDEASKAILQDPDQSAGSAIAHIGLGTVLSGAIGGASGLWNIAKSDGVNSILNMIKSDSEGVGATLAPKPGDLRVNGFMKNALNVALGPSPEMIDARVANLDKIREAPSFQEVYDKILDHLNNVGDDVTAHKQILADAQAEFKSAGYDAALANQSAKTAFKDAQTQVIEDLTRDAFSKAPAVANSVDVLNDKAIAAAQSARELLNETNKQIPLKDFYEKINKLQEDLVAQSSPLSMQQAESLGKYAEQVKLKYGPKPDIASNIVKSNNIDAPSVKNIIVGLDALSKWNSSQLEGGLAPYYRQIRYTLDSILKEQIPGYAKAIKPAAEMFELIDKLSKYGTTEDATRAISALKNKVNFTNEMPILRELEHKTGIKFTHDLDSYASPALRELKMSKIPEYAEAERAAKALAYYKHPENYASLEHTIMTDPEWLAAMEAKNNIKGLTEVNLQGKMQAAMGNKNISARSLMEKLPMLKGMSIPEILDLISVRQSFEKGAGMGSRNVKLGSALGAGAGGVLGGVIGGLPGASIGSSIGGGIGAITGGVIDRKGPVIAAKILDKYVSSFGSLPEKAGLSERAIRYGLKAALGSEANANANAFKAAAEYSEAVSKGLNSAKKAAKAVFSKGVSVLPRELIPEKEKIKNLDKKLKELHKNPEQHLAFGGEVGHYMPDHVEAIAKTGATAVDLLNSMRPEPRQSAPLDREIQPSEASKAAYRSKLEVAEQPLMLMHHLKNGTLLPSHIDTVKQIYPSFYEHMNQELTNSMLDHISSGGKVPYNIRKGMSMLTGQPMDSTMTPSSAQSIIQSSGAQQMQQQMQKSKGSGASSTAIKQFDKVNKLYLTSLQEKTAQTRK